MHSFSNDIPSGCQQIAPLGAVVPDRSLLVQVLKANGFTGQHGVDFLSRNYATIVHTAGATNVFAAAVGVFNYRSGKLISARELWFRHHVMKQPMLGGFRGEALRYERERYRTLTTLLQGKFDVIGCIGRMEDGEHKPRSWLRRPPYVYWLARDAVGWLAVDQDYWLVNRFESLKDLLCWRNEREFAIE